MPIHWTPIPEPRGVTMRWQRCPRCWGRHIEISDIMFCSWQHVPHPRKFPSCMVQISGRWSRCGHHQWLVLDRLRRSIGLRHTVRAMAAVAYDANLVAEPDRNLLILFHNLGVKLRGSRLEFLRPGGGSRDGFRLVWRAQV